MKKDKTLYNKSSWWSWSSNNSKTKTQLKIFWGYAAWGSTQLLAEVWRRSWGISDTYNIDFNNWIEWDVVVEDMKIAKESEYSKAQGAG